MNDKKEIEDSLVKDKRWVTDYLEQFNSRNCQKMEASLTYEEQDLVYRSDSLMQQGALLMGIVSIPDATENNVKREIDPELSISVEI